MIKKILKILAYILVIFCLVVIGIFGFTQSKFFKERLRVIIISELSQSLKSEFYLGEIKGNFITGFSIDSLSIYNEKEKFLSIKGIKLSHDPLTIAGKKITLKKISIDNIDLNIVRGTDSIWNFKNILQPSSKESKPLNWTIDIRDLKINSGRFSVYDSLKNLYIHPHDSNSRYFDYKHFYIQNFKLALSAQIKDKDYKLKVKEIQFSIPSINFNLNTLSTDIILNKKNIEVSNLLIETDNTSLRAEASLKELNLFEKLDLKEFEEKPVKLKLLSNRFDLNEFKKFLPAVYFLNGLVYADIEAEGNFGNVKVNHINLKTNNSYLQLSGNILNLHHPQNLFLDVKIFNSQVTPSDVSKLLPVFKIPKFQAVKTVFLNATYNGTPLDFSSKIDIYSSDLGNATAFLKLNLQDTIMRYRAEFNTKHLDLDSFTQNKIFKTKLNCSGFIEGEGIKLNNLNSKFSLKIDTSVVNDINYETVNVDIGLRNQVMDANISISSDAGFATIKSKFNFMNSENPIYEFNTGFSKFNIGKIINDAHWLSDMNININALISGADLDKMNGSAELRILHSVIANKILDEETINLRLDQTRPVDKELSIRSKNFDLAINGNFSLISTFKIFENIFSNVSTEINKKLGKTDLVYLGTDKTEIKEKYEDFEFSYHFKITDINLFTKLFLNIPFNFNGDISGEFKYEQNQLIGKSYFQIIDYFVGTESKGILISNANLNIIIGSISNQNVLENSKIQIKFSAEQINFGKIKLYDASLDFNYINSVGFFALKNRFEWGMLFDIKMTLYNRKDYFQFDMTQCNLILKDYHVRADTVTTLALDKNGFKIDNLRFISSLGEKLYFNGSLDDKNNLSINTQIDRLLIENIKLFKANNSTVSKIRGNTFLRLNINGTLEQPLFTCQFTLDSIMYKNSNFGKISGLLTYKEKQLSLSISAVNPVKDNEKMLSVFGFLPVDLSLTPVENRFPEEDVSIIMKTDGFPLEIFNPLIPFIDDLSGILVCDLNIGGTTMNPIYFGKINFDDVRFQLLSNYIYYNLNGSLLADKDRIYFSDFYVKNEKSDFSAGIVNISGYFTIREYKFEKFDLNAKGQLLLLKEGVRKKMQNVYGKLIATTEEEGISFKGSIQSSNIAGTIVIKEANLVFPPAQTQTYVEGDNLIKYVAINDTMIVSAQKDIKTEFYYPDAISGNKYWVEETPTSNRFLDGLTYDLVLYTKGTTNIRMIFNPATNEELYAELDGRVNLQRFSNKNYFIGEILISERSYYNFFKRFEASGKLKFIGDPNNPELEINATYTGIRQIAGALQDTALIEQKVVIGLDITGTRLEPKLKMSIKIDDKDYNDVIQNGDLQSDAISFLFTNKFRDDLSTREKSDIISGIGTTAGKSLIAGATSTMLSGILTDFLRKEFGFIRSAEVTYAGGSLQESADLRLSGQIFNAYWRFGGRIFDDINNANVSFILNFGDIFESQKVKNFYLELERRVDGREYGLDRKLTNSAKIYYKWSF